MSKKLRLCVWLCLTIILILSAGCAGNSDEVPTVDPNTLFTAAAQTVQAEFTQAAALIPTNTATLPPTPTQATVAPLVTNTPFPTLPGISSTLPAAGTQTTALPGIATATSAGGTCGGDDGEWVSNSPADGKHVQASANFDLIWRVKNTGTTTWTTDYFYRHYVGDNYASKSSYQFWDTDVEPWLDGVQPGETAEFIVHVLAPSDAGHYEMYWVLSNPEGCNFQGLSFDFYVD